MKEAIRNKVGVQNDYSAEISQKTGTRPSAVSLFLKNNEIDPLTILQGIGSGRIKKQDFVNALLSDEGTLEFLRTYNSDGKWGSVWNSQKRNESTLIKYINKIINEEIKKVQLKESSSNQEIQDIASDLVDFIGKTIRCGDAYYDIFNSTPNFIKKSIAKSIKIENNYINELIQNIIIT